MKITTLMSVDNNGREEAAAAGTRKTKPTTLMRQLKTNPPSNMATHNMEP